MTKSTWEIMLNRHTYQIISSRGNTGETRKRLREQLKSVDRGSLVPAPGAEGGAKGKVAEPPGPGPTGFRSFLHGGGEGI